MRSILFLLLIAGMSLGDFSDDFESYSAGQDPDISPNWTREPSGGSVLVVQEAGNKLVQSDFQDSTYIGYLCTGAGLWQDGSVSMRFRASGNGSLMNVLARMQISGGESYVGGIVTIFQPVTTAYIAHVSVTGDYEILGSYSGPSMPPGTWVEIRLELAGTGPSVLSLYCNDQLMGQVSDSTYDLAQGFCGFALLYQNSLPTIGADDFSVALDPQYLAMKTFAAIKRVFSSDGNR